VIFVSVTRLRLRKLRFLPGFAWFALRSTRQAKRAAGNVHTESLRERGLVFWTITLWESEQAMRQFRNSGPHRAVMPRLANWCDEATYVHWTQSEQKAPTLSEAHARLTVEGTVSKLRYPSQAHATRSFPKPDAKV
jgi:hypothetical protein